MFRNNKEFFDFVLETISLLTKNGHDEWSTRLSNALKISFMPGEVFGAIRLVFRDLQATNIPTQLGIKKDIDSAISSLDTMLNNK